MQNNETSTTNGGRTIRKNEYQMILFATTNYLESLTYTNIMKKLKTSMK